MASFGAQLKREREKRKISLDDVSASSKIGTRFLRAIEDDQFDQLPGGIFNKGFIRAYARHLGLDEEQTIADYLEASGTESSDTVTPESQPEVAAPEEPTAARIPWGSFAIVLLLAALTLATLNFYSREKSVGTVSDVESSQRQSSPLPSVELSPTKAIVQSPEPAQSQTVPAMPAKTQSAAGSFVVLLKARDDSWISGSVDGTELPGQLLAASSEKLVSAKDSVTLKAGNIGALDIYFNGQKVPSQGEEGEVKTVAFDARGLHVPGKP
jgi:cytoskeleton protein RodZ